MYKYSKDLLPPIFDNYFILNRCVNNYETRNANNLYVPFYHYKLSRSTIRFVGPKIWNYIDLFLKQSPSLSSFKKKFKLQLIRTYC